MWDSKCSMWKEWIFNSGKISHVSPAHPHNQSPLDDVKVSAVFQVSRPAKFAAAMRKIDLCVSRFYVELNASRGLSRNLFIAQQQYDCPRCTTAKCLQRSRTHWHQQQNIAWLCWVSCVLLGDSGERDGKSSHAALKRQTRVIVNSESSMERCGGECHAWISTLKRATTSVVNFQLAFRILMGEGFLTLMTWKFYF